MGKNEEFSNLNKNRLSPPDKVRKYPKGHGSLEARTARAIAER